jgi:phage protein D
MWGRPLLSVSKGGGANIFGGSLGGYLVSVVVHDAPGQTSDRATITLANPGGRLPTPRKGDIYSISMGWAHTGLVLLGLYSVQRVSKSGGGRQVEQMVIHLRAADFVAKLQAAGREAFDETTTAGQLFQRVAGQAGLGVAIDPELAQVKIGYRLRWDQSLIDFATEIGEELGASVKPAGGKLCVMKRGTGRSGGGQAMPVIQVRRTSGYTWEVEIEPRPVYGHVAAAWQDPKTGKRKLVKRPTGRNGPYRVLPHPYRDQADAERAADAEAYDLGHNSGSGHFEQPGMPTARAEAKVVAAGYGEGVDGLWQCESVEHRWDPKGYVTIINVGSGKHAKG